MLLYLVLLSSYLTGLLGSSSDQPMSITFDSASPRNQGRRVVSAPSLLNRIQKPPLLDRLSKGQQVQSKNPAPSYVSFPCLPRDHRLNPLLPLCSQNGGPIRNRPRTPARAPKKPLTAEELDKELEAFMKDDTSTTAATTSDTTEAKPSEDVDMAA